MIAYALDNTPLTLNEPPLASGGEGAIYEIAGYPHHVAKIYIDPADAKLRENKIKVMVSIGLSSAFCQTKLVSDIAWPLFPLFDGRHNFIGFGMERINAHAELDDLYVYPPRATNVSIRDRLSILISLCDVIHRLHSTGQVFGDFNPNNIKIRSNNTVAFVDADSYHISSSGKQYRCVVCASGYVAPEVIKACHGTTYADCPTTTFTQYTDRFALAIHVFRMLMNGFHPYFCARPATAAGSLPAPKPLDMRVEHGITPFFKNLTNYTTPPFAPDLNALPPYIRELFRKAFVDGNSNPACRPSAVEWQRALSRFQGELVACNHGNRAHHYWNGYHTCPYCEADQLCKQKFQPAHTQPKAQPAPQPPTPAPVPQPAARPAAQPAPAAPAQPAKPINNRWFWFVTLFCTIMLQIYWTNGLFLGFYQANFDNDTLVLIGRVLGAIAGILGCVAYNLLWSRGLTSGRHKWYDYLLSLLTSFGFALGFGVAMVLIIFTFQLFGSLLLAVLGLFLLISIFSGK